tara:strand:+ start:1584 stop:2435 length:852 start_codon:yes stop_codon:yes gene_type:complete
LKIKISFILLIAMFSVSISPIVARYLFNVPAIAISFWRMCFGAIILWFLSIFFQQPSLKKSERNQIILAGVFLGIHFVLFFESLKLTTIANATFLGTLAPLFTFIIERIFLKRKYQNALLLGLAIAITGVIIILSNQFDFSSRHTFGNILAILCSIFLGISFIISENIRQKISTISFARTIFTSASITLLIIAFIYKTPLIEYKYSDFLGLLILGIIPTVFGHGALYFAIRYIPPTIVASIPMGEPVIASIIAWYLFNESIDISTIIGGFIILSGLFLLIKKK